VDVSKSTAEAAVDAVVHVTISDNELMAFIRISPPRNGGAAPTAETIGNALKNHGVIYNINTEKLAALEANPIYHSEILIAKGTSPVNGTDGTAFIHINTDKSQNMFKENDDGSVDFYDLDNVENVSQGQLLCTITPPTEGTPGMSAKGNEIKQKRGRPAPSYAGRNTELNEDGTAIISKINGTVEFNGKKLIVNDVYHVRGDVDASIGNLKVAGNLTIYGMVLPGFVIEAGGNISVEGTVESASLKAGGSIKLKSGIIGSEIHCAEDLTCRFIENCNVSVGGNITAEYILNSIINCGKNLKLFGKKAKIIGGSCIVGQDIEAETIGSVTNVRTKIELCTDPANLEQQRALRKKVAEIEKSIEGVKPLIAILRKLEAARQLTPDKKEILESAVFSHSAYVDLLDETKKALEEITQLIDTQGFGKIKCKGSIYPGTTIIIGSSILPISDVQNNKSVYYSEGCIHFGSVR